MKSPCSLAALAPGASAACHLVQPGCEESGVIAGHLARRFPRVSLHASSRHSMLDFAVWRPVAALTADLRMGINAREFRDRPIHSALNGPLARSRKSCSIVMQMPRRIRMKRAAIRTASLRDGHLHTWLLQCKSFSAERSERQTRPPRANAATLSLLASSLRTRKTNPTTFLPFCRRFLSCDVARGIGCDP